MIILSESGEEMESSASARDLAAMTNAASLTGFRIYRIPQDFDVCGDAEGALWHVPLQEEEADGLWIGFIPSPERYEAIYAAALSRNIRLLNSPAQHRAAQEFDSAYARLEGLTPASVVVRSVEECAAAGERLGYPIFVKGVVQSRKARGWKACVAGDLGELGRLVQVLLELDSKSRGRVVLRRLVQLRHARKSGQDFPFGREYRVFVLAGRIVGMGYYWEGDDPLRELLPEEERTVRAIALEAAARLDVPYVAIDVGQLTDNTWIVIESGDAQFSGISQIPILGLWNEIRERGSRGREKK